MELLQGDNSNVMMVNDQLIHLKKEYTKLQKVAISSIFPIIGTFSEHFQNQSTILFMIESIVCKLDKEFYTQVIKLLNAFRFKNQDSNFMEDDLETIRQYGLFLI